MMSPELLEAENRTAALSKRTDKEQSINNDEGSGVVGIQIADSRDDLFVEQVDHCPSSDGFVEEKEVAKVQLQHEAAAAAAVDVTSSTDAHNDMVTELRQALLAMRGINRQLQSENDRIKEENISLAETAHSLAEDWTTLKEENEHMFEELEMLRARKADSTPYSDIASSTLSAVSSSSTFLQGDQLFDFDESSHANDLNSPPSTIDADFQYTPPTPIAQRGSIYSDDVLDNEETTKFIDRPNSSRKMSDLTQSLKSRDKLYDIDELKITTSKDEDNVTLRMKLELKRDECNELQKDLGKITQAFCEQSRDLDECQSLVVKLQTENDELKFYKCVEGEIDNMWAHVKEMDKVKDLCTSLLAEKDELEASVIGKSNEIAVLKAELENAVQPEMVHSRVDEIERDLKVLVLQLKTAVVEKSCEIAELKDKLRNPPCPDWVQTSIDEIREDLEVILAERDQLRADVVRKKHEIAELKDKLRNPPLGEELVG